MKQGIALSIALFLLASGCTGEGGQPDIKVSYPKVAHSMKMENAISAFMFIQNDGEADDYLISARIKEMPDKMVEIHDVVDGKMVAVEKIKIPAGEVVELKMGSYHIMGMGITEHVNEITLVLSFGKTGDIEVVATVPEKEETATGGMDMEEATGEMDAMTGMGQ